MYEAMLCYEKHVIIQDQYSYICAFYFIYWICTGFSFNSMPFYPHCDVIVAGVLFSSRFILMTLSYFLSYRFSPKRFLIQ